MLEVVRRGRKVLGEVGRGWEKLDEARWGLVRLSEVG
jgi:hypothetical protein